ncbi:MAG: PP2C family protein-serine/threonine phosphatase [Nitrolancea sp.]
MSVTFDVSVAKTNKYASRESGDTVEIVERPAGGLSVVVVDGQGSGEHAKRLSLLIAGRTVGLLNEGVRDGTAARAAHDFLFAHRGGRVSSALDILSIDLASRTVVLSRNSEIPMLVFRAGQWETIHESGGRIGIYRVTRPKVLEFPCTPGSHALLVTDGVLNAGKRFGLPINIEESANRLLGSELGAEEMAERMLREAMRADRNRPQDDMTVVALRLEPGIEGQAVRRLSVSVPLSN